MFARLDAIDRRILARRDRRYDAPIPRWLRYSFVVSAPFIFAFSTAARAGGVWWIVLAVSFAAWLATLVAAVRWERAHRVARTDEFEIAVDRNL
jgi:hypothetical protein